MRGGMQLLNYEGVRPLASGREKRLPIEYRDFKYDERIRLDPSLVE